MTDRSGQGGSECPDKNSRIGLFGGTFDPIHFGHLEAVEAVHRAFHLNRTYLIPTAVPPHKGCCAIASGKQRMEMIHLAVGTDAEFEPSGVELERQGISYTIDTVRFFQSLFSEQTFFFLILGLDAFLEFDTWKEYQHLLDLAEVVVMMRPSSDPHPQEHLKEFIARRISNRYVYHTDRCAFMHPEKRSIFWYNDISQDISSTRVRELRRQGRSIRHLVPASVESYIQKEGLYI